MFSFFTPELPPQNYIHKVPFKYTLSATIWEDFIYHRMRGILSMQTLIISRTIHTFDWESTLNNLDTNDQVSVFISTIMNIITNFVANETITSDYWDPSWMNSLIKNLICDNDNFYKKIVQKSNNIYHLCI